MKKDGKAFAFPSPHEKSGVCLLLEGCTNGVCAGVCIAGTYVDLFCGAGACAVVVNAVGNVAGNAAVCVAGLTGFFMGIHCVHELKSFQL